VVVLLHKENPSGSVGITLAGGVDCETKEISVHRVLLHSIADKEGSIQRGDRILSINGRSMRGLTHRESLAVLKQPRPELVLVLSRAKLEEGVAKLRARTESVETIVEGTSEIYPLRPSQRVQIHGNA
jgi:C-terminal processing protease CtpA/Prc